MTVYEQHKGRWKLTLEYDGTPFAGWQKQANALTVQESLEDAIHKFCGETVTTHVAGRTDAGVHALGQVAHVDLEKESDPKTVRDAINFHLRPKPVAVVKAQPASEEFHARFSALRRVYCYKILMGRRADVVIDANRVWHVSHALDVSSMEKAAKHLLGEHDFTTFRDSACQAKSPVRSIDKIEFRENKTALGYGHHLEIWVEAKSFLHHMVRNITGTLKMVGEGKWQPDDVKAALEAKDRTRGGPTAPAEGLYFVRVEYDDSAFIKGIDSLL